MRSIETKFSFSELVDDAVRLLFQEEQDDLEDVIERQKESEMSYEKMIVDLKKYNKI